MDTFNLINLQKELERDEGRRNKPYKDSKGILTIGVGWNLEEKGLPDAIIDQLFCISTNQAREDAESLFKGYNDLTPARQRVVVNMAFNLGRSRLRGFKKMITAVKKEDWKEAATQMLDSKWHDDVGKRAERLAKMMRSG